MNRTSEVLASSAMSSNTPIQAPTWPSAEYMENLFKNIKKDDSIRVKSFTPKLATARGENYGSIIVRANVEYTRDESDGKVSEEEILVLKIALDKESAIGDITAKCAIFETEIEMTKTLKKMNEILNEKTYKLSPDFLYAKLGNPSFLVMEDLAPLGFRIADRQAGLDLQHSLAVMRGLAKFHATSVALYEKDPTVISSLQRGIFYDNSPAELQKFVNDGIKTLGNEAANWPELDPCISKKLLKCSEVGYEKGVECARPKEHEFNVINHGDCWVNNILFRYDSEGKVIDNTFVDFQASVWTSPAIDILYFFGTSLNDEAFEHHRERLIDEYLNVLTKTMLRINCRTKPPSSMALRDCLKERELFSLFCASMSLPIILIDKSQAVDLSEALTPGNDYVYPGYKAQLYRQRVAKRLKSFNSLGLLDV